MYIHSTTTLCDVQMFDLFDAKTKHCKGADIPAQVQFMEEYAEEMKLNAEFNRFVANFQQAYQGPNTAHAQVDAKYNTRKWKKGGKRSAS